MNRQPLNRDKAAGRIAEQVLSFQKRFARALNKRTESASDRQKKLFLLLLILVMGGYSLYLLLMACS